MKLTSFFNLNFVQINFVTHFVSFVVNSYDMILQSWVRDRD